MFAIYSLLKFISLGVFVFFLKSVTDVGDFVTIIKLGLKYWRDGGDDAYSKLTEAIFPETSKSQSYHMSCKLAESGSSSAETVSEMDVPLLARHPLILGAALIVLYIAICFLYYIHWLLVKVINIMEKALPEKSAPEEGAAHQKLKF